MRPHLSWASSHNEAMKTEPSMNVIFGEACDGRSYPDFPGAGDGALGAPVVGPAGLLQLIETALGLSGPPVSEIVRIAAWGAKCRAALQSRPDPFWASSFAADAWGTARVLLERRDRLVMGGWKRTPVGKPRIDDLAAIEAAGPPLPGGACDRLRILLAALRAKPVLPIARLTLAEPRDLLGPGLDELVDALAACGVTVEETCAPAPASDTDLGRIQDFLASGTLALLEGDGTFLVASADTALMAAEGVAELLARTPAPSSGADPCLVLDQEADSLLLDQALQIRGLPALGLSASSPWRGALQVLPLAFSVLWAPLDPKALIDLLLLPRPPIPRSAARRLARALAREPGTGGEAWKKAWAGIEADLVRNAASEEDTARAVTRRLDRIRAWLRSGVIDRRAGMPASEARAVASRVADWARATAGAEADPLFLSLAACADALGEAIGLLGVDLLPALLLERMIEQALGHGVSNPDHVAGAGALRAASDPGAIWGPVPRLVWWNFRGPGEAQAASPWTRAETQALDAAGVRLESPELGARRAAWRMVRPLRMATTQAILVRPLRCGDEATLSHPLAHQLHPILKDAPASVFWNMERLLEAGACDVAGVRIPRKPAVPRAAPSQRPVWSLEKAAAGRLLGRRESATSLERLSACQLRWLLLDVCGLSRGRLQELPRADQLIGNVAHAIAARLFAPGPAPDPDEARTRASALFDETVDAIAAPLRRPENARELASARVRIPEALADLARLMRRGGLQVVGAELERSASFEGGLSLLGRLDLLVRSPAGELCVIDLKWSRTDRRRREELASGRALQLACYGAIADPQGSFASGGFYLLRQRRLLQPAGAPAPGEQVEAARDLQETWNDLVATWGALRRLTAEGVVVASGIEGALAHLPSPLPVPPAEKPCTYCELTTLCRIPAKTK